MPWGSEPSDTARLRRYSEELEESAAELALDPMEPMEAPLYVREAALETLQKPELDTQAPMEWEQLIAEGKRLEAEGDSRGAALAYVAALSKMGDSGADAVSDLAERATVLCQANGWGSALELAALTETERALAVKEMDQIRRYLDEDLLQAAAEECYIAIGALPDYLPVQIRLAEVYERQGAHLEASDKYRSVLQVYRLRGQPFLAMGICETLLTTATPSEQVDLLETMRDLRQQSPADERLRTSLAQAYFRFGQMEQAITEFAELAALYESREQHARAIPLYHAMLQLAPDDLELRERLSRAYMATGMDAEACDELESLAEEQLDRGLTEKAASSLRLALERCDRGDQRRALRMRERLVKLAPRDAQVRRELIASYLKLGRASQALAEARSWAESSLQAGTREEAQQALNQVLQLDPWNAEARRRLKMLEGNKDTPSTST